MLAPVTPPAHADPAPGPTPRQELAAAHYLAQGETVGMAARLAGIKPEALQRLQEESEFEALVEECRRLEALPKAEQEARLERFFRRAVERALADGRVGAIAAAMRLLGLASRGGGRGPRADGDEDVGLTEEEEREAGKPWGMVPDGEGGWLTPDGREAMPGRELEIVLGKDGPIRCLETVDIIDRSPPYIDFLEGLDRRTTQEMNRTAFPYAGVQWDPVTRTLWHWESAKAEADRLREQATKAAASAPWDPVADAMRAALPPEPAAPPKPKAAPKASPPIPAAPSDLATRLDRLLATGAPAGPAEADLAEAVCSFLWPNWPPYQGALDGIELWRLRDLLARTPVSPQVLARLGSAGTGPSSGHRPATGPPDPFLVPMTATPLPIRRRVELPPGDPALASESP
jgi:hypothetical protein